ncbi:hypothetical protein [Synechococcus sp. CBW1107]|uniref:hypothetical protein n=1 Tax=Synechococcus sp. CBW1107 TaxID=2789857 RepID=UPI002AD46F14|nr:hypothetical protein [Synechococcus sp. CBW1107]CAK6701046.1 hypothetical protein IFHNHDMJ_02990 [Synechococcus sp. CBW1107]
MEATLAPVPVTGNGASAPPAIVVGQVDHPEDIAHLEGEGVWTPELIEQAVAGGWMRSIDSAEARRLGFVKRLKDGTRWSGGGLLFTFGWSRDVKTGARRLFGHLRFRKDRPREVPKYLVPAKVVPICWTPPGVEPAACLGRTEGFKDAAIAWFKLGIPLLAQAAPSYYRGVPDAARKLPWLGDSDSVLIPEVARLLVAMGKEQHLRLCSVPLRFNGQQLAKAGVTELLKAGATRDDFLQLLNEALRLPDWLANLPAIWESTELSDWHRAHPNRWRQDVPNPAAIAMLKADMAGEAARWCAFAGLRDAAADAILETLRRWSKVRKDTLTKIFRESSAKEQATRRKAEAKTRATTPATPGQKNYCVGPTTTIEAAYLANEAADPVRPLAARDKVLFRWDPERQFWTLQPDMGTQARISAELERYFTPETRYEPAKFRFTTTDYMKRVHNWMLVRLHDEALGARPSLVPFRNGALDLETGELIPHTRELGCTFQINGEWSEGIHTENLPAFAPNWHRFLQMAFREDTWELVRAAIRYLLDPTLRPGKAIAFVGPTGSGKGLALRTISSLVDRSAVTAITKGLCALASPEAIYQYVAGRRLVLFMDLRGPQSNHGAVYDLIDQAPVSARRLFESSSFTVDFAGRMAFGYVSTPPFQGDNGNDGWARRIVTVPVQAVPESAKAACPDLEDRIQGLRNHPGELGMIASWAFAMARTDVERYLFRPHEVAAVEEALTAGLATVDSLHGWIDQLLIPAGPKHSPSWSDMETCYRGWCAATGYKPLATNRFRGQLRQFLATNTPDLLRDQSIREPMESLRNRMGEDADSNQRRRIRQHVFGFRINPAVWTRDIPQLEEPNCPYAKRYGHGSDGFLSIDHKRLRDDHWLYAWRDQGASGYAESGFLNKDRLPDASGAGLLELRRHRPGEPIIDWKQVPD